MTNIGDRQRKFNLWLLEVPKEENQSKKIERILRTLIHESFPLYIYIKFSIKVLLYKYNHLHIYFI